MVGSTVDDTPLPPTSSTGPGGSDGFGPRRSRRWLVLGMVLVLVTGLAVAAVVLRRHGDAGGAAAGPTKTSVLPTTTPVISAGLGVFRGTDPGQVQAFNAWLGRDVGYVVDFPARASWHDISSPQYMIDAWKGTPYRKVYSIPMLPQDPADTIVRGATGEYDAYFRQLAERLVAGDQQNAILRLGWEFNLDDSAWSSDDPTDFVKYWREIVSAMRSVPGQKFQFDWNLNNGDSRYDAVKYYPGDDVVDYVGVDSYDIAYTPDTYPYPANCDPACRAQRQARAWDTAIYGGARGLHFWSKFAADHGKPMTLPEWGLWQRDDGHGGDNDPDYLRRMADFIADPANNVAYQSYFEVDGEDGAHRLMTTYPQAGDVYRQLFGPK